jgi:hypothetical protein
MAKQGVVSRLRRRLAELLSPDDEPLAARRSASRAVPQVPLTDTDFDSRLRELLERPGQLALMSGRVNIIGLQKIKERFGSAWERMAERAERIARNTIERHLDDGDMYTSVNSITYVMVFARLSQEQAQMKCLMIADEIGKALFGEQGGDMLEVKTAVARVDGKLNLETISLADQLFASLAGEDDLVFVEEGEVLPKTPARSLAPQDLLAGLRFAYRPIWDQSRNVISTYLCVAQVPTSDIGAAVSDAELALAGDDEALTRLDDAVRQRVIGDLRVLHCERRRLLLTLPIHFETLSPVARRRRYLTALGKQLAGEIDKMLVVELTGVSVGVPQSRLVELIAPLRQLCRGVILRVPLEMVDFAHVKGCGAVAIGCDIGTHPGPEVALMHQLNRFGRAAASASVPTYVRGAHTLSQVAGSIGAGFSYIDGDGVSKLVDHPREVADFRLADLYRPIMRG